VPARLKLNVFSPLPPLRTDIANHTAYVLPPLGRMADVTVWTTQESWSIGEVEGVRVRRYRPEAASWSELNDAAATFFNIGNNTALHGDIFRMASTLPGVVVLHDTVLQHFFAGLALHGGWRREYLAAMRRQHGAEGLAQARRLLAGETGAGELAERFPLTLAAAERATALVCHTPDGARALEARTRVPVYQLDLSLDLSQVEEPPPAGASGTRGGGGGPPRRVVVFGFLGFNRRLPSLLRALGEMPERDTFRLDVYGEVDDEAETRRLIASLGIAHLVEMHGYVPRAELDRGIARAHLAVNLRHPTMGEASGSQLRIWAHGLPSLVTRTGWYATLPEDTVFFVDPEDEVEGIRRHLARLHARPEIYEAAGRRARGVVAAWHSPERYAESLLEISRQAPMQHGRRVAVDLARASSRALASMVGMEGLQRAAPGVAREIALLTRPSRSD
jgi:glycosyltransferase involved in cell wall biosynthesis